MEELESRLAQTMEKKKELEEKLGQWKDETSDALSLLRALGAYMYQEASESFCMNNLLHTKTMKESSLLYQQLVNIVKRCTRVSVEEEEVEFSNKIAPPTPRQKLLISQTIISGLLDHVAKKMTPDEAMSLGVEWKRGAVPYISCMGTINEPLYIHRNSSVYNRDGNALPKFVAYSELLKTSSGRTCMKGVTVVNSKWLANLSLGTSNCSFSPPVLQPLPFYDSDRQSMMGFCTPAFGYRNWELPLYKREFPEGPDRIRWFARLLIEGHILPIFSTLKDHLNSNPAQLTKAKVLQPKIEHLLQSLGKEKIDSLPKLVNKWKANKLFLQRELTMWIQPSFRPQFAVIWSDINNYCMTDCMSSTSAVNNNFVIMDSEGSSDVGDGESSSSDDDDDEEEDL